MFLLFTAGIPLLHLLLLASREDPHKSVCSPHPPQNLIPGLPTNSWPSEMGDKSGPGKIHPGYGNMQSCGAWGLPW